MSGERRTFVGLSANSPVITPTSLFGCRNDVNLGLYVKFELIVRWLRRRALCWIYRRETEQYATFIIKEIYVTMADRGKSVWLENFYQGTRQYTFHFLTLCPQSDLF